MNYELNEKQMDAFRDSVTKWTESEYRWNKLAQIGATDKEINDELNWNFRYEGGSCGPGLASIWYRPNPPRIWFTSFPGEKELPDLFGKRLVDIIRYIFNVNSTEQLELFDKKQEV